MPIENPSDPKQFRLPAGLLQQIWNKHGLGALRQHSYSRSGKVNPLLYVNHRYVLKINLRDPQLPKLRREAVVLRLLAGTEVPVPRLIALDESRELMPYDYLIMSRLEGKEIYQNWDRLAPAMRGRLCRQAGQLLAVIHRQQFPFFGDIANGVGELPHWHLALEQRLFRQLKDCQEWELYEPGFLDQVRAVFERTKSLLQSVERPCLVHNDFHLGNLLYQGARISGVLDFEWALAGDVAMDFSDPFTHEQAWQYMLEGYRREHAFSPQFEAKISLYQLLTALELSVVARQHWSQQQLAYYQERARHLLAALQRSTY